MDNLKVIPSAIDKRFSRYHFFACKYGFISNDVVYLFFLDSKKIEVSNIIDVNVIEKHQKIMEIAQYKILILVLGLLNLIFFDRVNSYLFQLLLLFSILLGILIKIEIVVFNINNKIEFKICKKEARKAKLFKRKILEYKKHLELNEFYN